LPTCVLDPATKERRRRSVDEVRGSKLSPAAHYGASAIRFGPYPTKAASGRKRHHRSPSSRIVLNGMRFGIECIDEVDVAISVKRVGGFR
jgi:hypothetical protein